MDVYVRVAVLCIGAGISSGMQFIGFSSAM
jgi:hypothetical protein